MLATVVILSGSLINAFGHLGHGTKVGFRHLSHEVKVAAQAAGHLTKELNPEKVLKIRVQ